MARNRKAGAHRLPSHIRPLGYKLSLKPDLKDFSFEGEEKIELVFSKPEKHLILHAKDINIKNVRFVERSGALNKAKVTYNKEAETVTLSFAAKLPKGKNVICLEFSGVLSDQMRGFYKSHFEKDGKDFYIATTQFESTDARRAFPCIDEPEAKAVFDVTLIVRDEHTAISNTTPVEIKEHDAGWKMVRFSPTPKMSTYLLAFIVGDFEFIESKNKNGILVRVFTTAGKKKQAEFALDVAKKCLSFYSDYFGIAYPMPVLDLIAIPDFSAGAMENWGAITYRESAILVDPDLTAPAERQWVALVIAHEIAHQWFGNLVTMKWWTDLWLNEGFASYIEYLAVDRIFPEWNIWNQFVISDLGAALRLDSLSETHPIEVEVGHPAEISEIFDAVSYSKGASVIRMLAEYLGEKDFRKGLTHYLKKYSYSNATTNDLWQALEDASGRPVASMMSTWTKTSGYPVLKVSEMTNRLKITQRRFYLSLSEKVKASTSQIWKVPLTYRSAGSKILFKCFFDKKTIEVKKPSGDKWIKFNFGEKGLYRVDYPSNLLKCFDSPIKKKILPVEDRLGIIRDVFAMAESGDSPTSLALETSEHYALEDDYTVWRNLIADLRRVNNLISATSATHDFRLFVRALLRQATKKSGFDRKSSDSHSQRLLRSLLITESGQLGEPFVVDNARQLFSDRIKGKKLDPDIRGAVYSTIAANGTENDYDKLYAMYSEETFPEEKNRLGDALTSFRHKKLIRRTLEFSMSEKVRAQDAPGIIAGVFSNAGNKESAWVFVKRNWDKILLRYGGGGHSLPRIIFGASGLTSISDASDVKKFFKSHSAPGAERTIRQVIEKITSNSAWLKRDLGNITGFLSKKTVIKLDSK